MDKLSWVCDKDCKNCKYDVCVRKCFCPDCHGRLIGNSKLIYCPECGWSLVNKNQQQGGKA